MSATSHEVPLLEFDPDESALREPWRTPHLSEAPRIAVACFFPEIIERLSSHGKAVLELPSGEPLWEVNYQGRSIGVFYPGVGAPLASYSFELAIAAGCRVIIGCGGAGAILSELSMGHHVIAVSSAIRDEGTSYHYLPPAREVIADQTVVDIMTKVVIDRDLPHMVGRTWTTDALFRETSSRVARRRDEGCLTVEMEASALLAVAAFRGVRFGQLLYAGDDLSGKVWNDRDWRQATHVRQLLFDIAAESAIAVDTQLDGNPAT